MEKELEKNIKQLKNFLEDSKQSVDILAAGRGARDQVPRTEFNDDMQLQGLSIIDSNLSAKPKGGFASNLIPGQSAAGLGFAAGLEKPRGLGLMDEDGAEEDDPNAPWRPRLRKTVAAGRPVANAEQF